MVNPLFCSIRSIKQAAQSHISTGWQNLDYNSDLSDLKVLAVSMQLYCIRNNKAPHYRCSSSRAWICMTAISSTGSHKLVQYIYNVCNKNNFLYIIERMPAHQNAWASIQLIQNKNCF